MDRLAVLHHSLPLPEEVPSVGEEDPIEALGALEEVEVVAPAHVVDPVAVDLVTGYLGVIGQEAHHPVGRAPLDE